MSDNAIRVVIVDQKVRDLFRRAPEAVHEAIGRLVQGAAVDIQAELRIAAPVGATGDLRRAIRYTFTPALLQAEVTPQIPYAADVEFGTGPHYVSVAPGTPLRRWAQMKGLNPYAIQNKIARRGTKAHPFVGPVYTKMKPQVERDIASGIAALVGSLQA